MALAKECNVGEGTISERLTKGLIVEQLATGRWSDEDIVLLVSVMHFTACAIQGGNGEESAFRLSRSSRRLPSESLPGTLGTDR